LAHQEEKERGRKERKRIWALLATASEEGKEGAILEMLVERPSPTAKEKERKKEGRRKLSIL